MQQLVLDRRYWLLPILGWSVLVLFSLSWNLNEAGVHSRELVHERARFIFEMVTSIRLWNARHGGVYALVDAQTPPNPHLEVGERDLTTPTGRRLTLVNPAYMTRQLGVILQERSDILIHITSLKPLNPGNSAKSWEAEALRRFEQEPQLKEWSGFSGEEAAREFRFIAPLVTEEPCLQCHEKQGYKLGDIRGGISITFPSGPLLVSAVEQEHHFELIHLGVWLLLSLLTLLGLSRHRRRLLQLQGVMARQEKMVEERTAQLQQEVLEREAAEQRLSRYIEATGEGLLVVDNKLRCTLSNPAALQMLGYDAEAQILGRNIHEFLCPQQGEPTPSSAEECNECHIRHTLERAVPLHDDEALFLRADGQTFPVDMRCSPIVVEGRTLGSVITFADISERKAQEAITWRLANTDTLTGLINRHHFHSRLEQTLAEAVRYERRLALLFLDLDGFKGVNDTLGHDAGDELLREGARRLRLSVRASDTVARLGGDEFTIIMPDIEELAEAESMCMRVITSLAEPFSIKGEQVHISASIGIAAYPDHGRDSDALLNHADAAMYRAKAAGKNTFRWYRNP